ncbi:MAG: purine-nucleoside phosphorylase [Defluviitaleaceae bacterium]|nr:purine-nucleoside phosphorylase [Defluviitaleaceae bacterium]
MTPHINAQKGQVAKTVLMPGDPLRAKFIAETFLTDVIQYNEVRGMLGFTGKYKGAEISVQGSGMGAPSIGIYSYELYKFYDVDNIIRVGTAGGMAKSLKLKDVIIASGASTNSDFAKQYNLPGTYSAVASFEIIEALVNASKNLGKDYIVGNILTSDIFYDADETALDRWRRMGVLAVEMEAAALFMNAAFLEKKAATILTISDIIGGEVTSPEERQTAFLDMMEIALEGSITL